MSFTKYRAQLVTNWLYSTMFTDSHGTSVTATLRIEHLTEASEHAGDGTTFLLHIMAEEDTDTARKAMQGFADDLTTHYFAIAGEIGLPAWPDDTKPPVPIKNLQKQLSAEITAINNKVGGGNNTPCSVFAVTSQTKGGPLMDITGGAVSHVAHGLELERIERRQAERKRRERQENGKDDQGDEEVG